MTVTSQKLFQDALQLPESERAALAAWLIESLDESEDKDSQVAWDAEVLRRVQELDSGAVKTIPWSQARQMIFEDPDESAAG